VILQPTKGSPRFTSLLFRTVGQGNLAGRWPLTRSRW
jgi:hypothetical protein